MSDEKVNVENLMNCDHTETAIRKLVCRNGAIQYVRQCQRCGNHCGAVPKTSSKVWSNGPVPPFDEDLKQRWLNRWRDEYAARQQAWLREKEEKDKEWWEWYTRYLLSVAWSEKRARVIQRAGGICEGCMQRPAVMAHHLTYEHAGNEFLWELRAVCKQCHDRCHPGKKLDGSCQ